MTDCVLLGDSHLAMCTKPQLVSLERAVAGVRIVNAAVSGYNSDDLRERLDVLLRLSGDIYVISVGSNDAAPWKQVPIERFCENLRVVIDRCGASRTVMVLNPPIDEARQRDPWRRTLDGMRAYHDAAAGVCDAMGVRTVDPWPAFADSTHRGDPVHVDDGLHLNPHGYNLLLARLAESLSALHIQPA